jgi:hypothetical protein
VLLLLLRLAAAHCRLLALLMVPVEFTLLGSEAPWQFLEQSHLKGVGSSSNSQPAAHNNTRAPPWPAPATQQQQRRSAQVDGSVLYTFTYSLVQLSDS